MYLLVKDPNGKNAAVINSQGDSKLSGFTFQQIQNNKCLELKKKIALLEQAMREKDETITALKNKIDVSNSVHGNGQNPVEVLSNFMHESMTDLSNNYYIDAFHTYWQGEKRVTIALTT